MTPASGTVADANTLVVVPPSCQLCIHVAHLAAPWSVPGLELLDMQLQQGFAAICDDLA